MKNFNNLFFNIFDNSSQNIVIYSLDDKEIFYLNKNAFSLFGSLKKNNSFLLESLFLKKEDFDVFIDLVSNSIKNVITAPLFFNNFSSEIFTIEFEKIFFEKKYWVLMHINELPKKNSKKNKSNYFEIDISPNLNIVNISRELLSILNYSKDEVIGKSILELITNNSFDYFYQLQFFSSKSKDNLNLFFDCTFISKYLDFKFFKCTLFPKINLESQKNIFNLRLENISNQKNNIEKLKNSHEKYEAILNTLNIGVWQFSRNSDEILWNKQMYDLYEVDPFKHPKITQNFWESFLEKKDFYTFKKNIRLCIKNNKTQKLFHRINSNKGNSKLIQVLVHPIYKDGKVIKVFGTQVDLTQIKENYDNFFKKNEILSLKQKKSFEFEELLNYWFDKSKNDNTKLVFLIIYVNFSNLHSNFIEKKFILENIILYLNDIITPPKKAGYLLENAICILIPHSGFYIANELKDKIEKSIYNEKFFKSIDISIKIFKSDKNFNYSKLIYFIKNQINFNSLNS